MLVTESLEPAITNQFRQSVLGRSPNRQRVSIGWQATARLPPR